jgi:hypothetical protein
MRVKEIASIHNKSCYLHLSSNRSDLFNAVFLHIRRRQHENGDD